MDKPKKSFVYKEKLRKKLEYPEQFVHVLEHGAVVGLNSKDTLKIERELGRKILFLLKLRQTEGLRKYQKLKSELLKRLILSTNCHRTMLYLLGFSPNEVVEQNFGSDIVEKYFGTPDHLTPNKQGSLETEVRKLPLEAFPLSVNFYYFDPRQGLKKADSSHSLVVLGISNSGKIICFHKDGIGDQRDVELTSLDKVYETRRENSSDSNYFSVHSFEEVKNIYNKFKQDKMVK